MDKEQLSKLASLDNPQTKKFLEDFAMDARKKILKARLNEEIIEQLKLLDEIYYRVPKILTAVIEYLVYKAKPIEPKTEKTAFGNFKGASHEEVVSKCLEMAKNIRYFEIEKIIKLAFDFSRNKNTTISSHSINLIGELLKYNSQTLQKIGIFPQTKAISFLEKELKTKDLQKENLAFIKIVLQNILETEANNSRMTAPDTLTFSHGDIIGNQNIAKLRRRAINFIFKVFDNLDSVEEKDTFFTEFEQACRMPMNSPRESEIGMIIQKDREYIVKKLMGISTNKDKILQPLAICLRIEHLLCWYFLHIELQQDLAKKFLKILYDNSQFSLFAAFVHDNTHIDFKKQVKKKTEITIDSYLVNIVQIDKDKALDQLNNLAQEAKYVDEWKFADFKTLLEKIGAAHPDLALHLIIKSVKEKRDLAHIPFLTFLLSGLRRGNHFKVWDKVYGEIFSSKEVNYLNALIASMPLSMTNDPAFVREKEDIEILTNLVERKAGFEFIKEPNNHLRYFTLNALRVSFRFNPKLIEKLIVIELKNNKDYFTNYLQLISTFPKEDGFSLKTWSDENKKFLMDEIIKMNRIDWHVEWVLTYICKPTEVIELFIQRIKFSEGISDDGEDYFSSKKRLYDAIPYDVNHELVEYVRNDKDVLSVITKYTSSESGLYALEISHIVKVFHLSVEGIFDLISSQEKDTDTLLKKTINAISSLDENNVDFLVKLASKTSNKAIHNSIYGRMASTGVVSGEFGIADAYRKKWQALEKYLSNENKNTKKFAEMAIKSLKASDDHHRKEAQKDKELRRIDFEANN